MKPLTKIYWIRFSMGVLAAIICIAYSFATGAINKNLILDRSAEAGEATPQYWFPSENDTAWSTVYARSGVKSLRINVSGSSAEWNSTLISIQGGNTYQIYGFFKGEVKSGRFSFAIRWFSDSDGFNQLSENSITLQVGNYTQWFPIAGDFGTPAEARSCKIVFRAVDGVGDLYGDDFEVRQAESITKLTTGVSIALIFYLLSYYLIKFKFMRLVEKTRKLLLTGVGIYFLSWMVFWILLYTLIGIYL